MSCCSTKSLDIGINIISSVKLLEQNPSELQVPAGYGWNFVSRPEMEQ